MKWRHDMTSERQNLNFNQNSGLRLTIRPKEAALALSISERTLSYLLKEGKICSFKLDRLVLIPIADLEDFVAQRAQADALEEGQL